jgi:tRNA(fMet)-specific endonuclease VapC
MDYLLDTNIVSSIMDRNVAVTRRFERISPADNVYSSVVTEGELRFGAFRMPTPRGERIRHEIDRVLSSLTGVQPITQAAAVAYGKIKHEILSRGVPLPDNDLWIAALAVANRYVLVSHDAGFGRIPNIMLEDWLA